MCGNDLSAEEFEDELEDELEECFQEWLDDFQYLMCKCDRCELKDISHRLAKLSKEVQKSEALLQELRQHGDDLIREQERWVVEYDAKYG